MHCREITAVIALSCGLMATAQARTTVTFRNGDNGYAGTQDAELRSESPSTNFGSATSIAIRQNVTGATQQGLIRFDGIIGNGAFQIPAGSIITGATLRFSFNDAGVGFSAHRMLVDWSEDTVTWDSLTGGVSADDIEAVALPSATLGSNNGGNNVPPGNASINVTNLIQAYANGAPNFGLALLPFPSGNNSVGFTSSEFETITSRPRLTVTWIVPTPGAAALAGLAAVGALRRRR
jgi:hypothetical protein